MAMTTVQQRKHTPLDTEGGRVLITSSCHLARATDFVQRATNNNKLDAAEASPVGR